MKMEIIRFLGSSWVWKQTLIEKIYQDPVKYGKYIVNLNNNIILSQVSLIVLDSIWMIRLFIRENI